MKKIVLLITIPFLALGLFAEDTEDLTASSGLLLQVSSLPEVKLGFTQSFKFPFMQGGNPLTEGNNIRLDLTAEVSPVSLNGLVNAIWTPIAFFELSAGVRLGTGWTLKLGDNTNIGIGLNLPTAGTEAQYSGNAFDAILCKIHLGGTIQFDFAALFPGDWNHVVFLSYHEINYHGNTRAQAGQAWYYENDYGENLNGFNYYGNLVIGYQMPKKPLFLNMVALMAEGDLFLYNTPNRHLWGDDMISWHFSGILSFEFTDNFGVALVTQLRTRRNFTNFDERIPNSNMYYKYRELDTSNPLRLEFYRIAALVTYQF